MKIFIIVDIILLDACLRSDIFIDNYLIEPIFQNTVFCQFSFQYCQHESWEDKMLQY